jgi:hypothetical protein
VMLRNWGLGRLVGSWVVYWVVLLAVVLAPVAREYWEIQRSDGHGTIDFTWSGRSLQMILLIVGPPLLMTLFWIAARPRRP